MPATVLVATDTADVGDTWQAWLWTTALDGSGVAADAVAAVVTDPDGDTATATVSAQVTPGLYLVSYLVAIDGDHLVVITVTDATNGNEVLPLPLAATDPDTHTPPDGTDTDEVTSYLGASTSATAEDVGDALAAEVAAQRRVCRVPVPFPDDLMQALKRRVARNLAARAIPVASFTTFEGGATATRVPGRDAEITRLEGPHRRLPVA